MNNNIETFKLQHAALEFKVNEVKKTVTAIEKFIVPEFKLRFTTVGVSKLNTEKGDTFDVETGKKLARAKAEKEAFSRFKAELKKFLKWNMALDDKLSATIEKMNNYIDHQKEYIKTF
nr:MAG: hypothetical protein [Bacteriophage sp.]